MKYVSVAELKAKLSGHLQDVKEGQALYVTSYGQPVAKLQPVEDSYGLQIRSPDRPVSDMRSLKGVCLAAHIHSDELLRLDRDRR